MTDDNGLRAIEARHAQDAVWFNAGHHDPNGYIGMAHADRGALLDNLRAMTPLRRVSVEQVRAAIIEAGHGDCLQRPAPPHLAPTVTIPRAAWNWLMGEGPDDHGDHFGDKTGLAKPCGGAFWWRTTFRRMCGL